MIADSGEFLHSEFHSSFERGTEIISASEEEWDIIHAKSAKYNVNNLVHNNFLICAGNLYLTLLITSIHCKTSIQFCHSFKYDNQYIQQQHKDALSTAYLKPDKKFP